MWSLRCDALVSFQADLADLDNPFGFTLRRRSLEDLEDTDRYVVDCPCCSVNKLSSDLGVDPALPAVPRSLVAYQVSNELLIWKTVK